ncbi:hypothetical protein [Azospirillum sp. SYSU D00513]
MDGIDLAEQLRADGCRVVFVTGRNGKTTRRRAEAMDHQTTTAIF